MVNIFVGYLKYFAQSSVKSSKKWPILLGITFCFAVVFLDSTIVPVALPTIQVDLNLTPVEAQWVINAYFLVMACFVLTGGKLADLLGARKVCCLGMVFFGVFSSIAGWSTSQVLMIICRSLQGLGGAVLLPAAMSIVVETYPERERGRAIGVLIAASSIFLSLGPFIGGFLTEYVCWRYIFWVNAPLVLIAIPIIMSTVPKSLKLKETFDVLGFFTYLGTLVFLILGLMQAREYGWGSSYVKLCFCCSLICALLLIVALKKASHPFFDAQLFSKKTFLGGNLIVFCIQFVVMISIFLSIFFQRTYSFSPLEAGMLTLISTLPLIVCAPLSGYLTDRFGPRWPVLIGLSLSLSGMLWLALHIKEPSIVSIGPGLIFHGTGIALAMTPVGSATIGGIYREKRGVASGTYSTVRNIAATCSVAVLGSLIGNMTQTKLLNLLAKDDVIEQDQLQAIVTSLMEGKFSELQAYPRVISERIKEAYIIASEQAMVLAILCCVFVSLFGIFLCFHFFKSLKNKDLESSSL